MCTDCHAEHGILSPVSGSKVAEMACSRCHESAVLFAAAVLWHDLFLLSPRAADAREI